MALDTKFLNKLKAFNINTYEAKIWTALLSRGVSTAGELSDIANVPRSRAYDVLESLERKGFIVMKLGKPIKYIAVPPEEVVERVKNNYNQEAQEKISAVDDLQSDDILDELNMLYNHGVELVEPTEVSGSLKDRHSLYNNLNMLIKKAEKSIVIMTTPEGLIRKSDALKKSLEKAGKRGVAVRIAAPISEEAQDAAALLSEVAQVRHIENIRSRFAVIDSNQAVFSLLDDKNTQPDYDAGVWVNTDFFAKSLENMFEHIWENQAKELQIQR
ncbi:MAG: TrmB family transcriptional regulator [Nanoarchaeota archaeon]